MKHTLIIGNGVDIQFGGFHDYGNQGILNRLIKNVENDKYIELGLHKNELQEILDVCVDTFNKIIRNEAGVPTPNDYWFLQMELDRVRRTYKNECVLSDIGLEDLFLSLEILYLNSQDDNERQLCECARNDILQPLILDAIYNDGKINDIYNSFPTSFIEFLNKYDAIFTLNYDTNIDNVVKGNVPIFHLHGSFDCYDGEKDVPSRFRHMYCNCIMTWYWLEKYGDEEKDEVYGVREFKNISGVIDMIGISPCNDEQLYIRLNENQRITACNYFYVNRSEAVELRKHLKGSVGKHITDRDVMRFWRKF